MPGWQGAMLLDAGAEAGVEGVPGMQRVHDERDHRRVDLRPAYAVVKPAAGARAERDPHPEHLNAAGTDELQHDVRDHRVDVVAGQLWRVGVAPGWRCVHRGDELRLVVELGRSLQPEIAAGTVVADPDRLRIVRGEI